MKSMIDILINYEEPIDKVKNSTDLIKNAIETTLEIENKLQYVNEISLTITNGYKIHQLNQKYRDIDKSTDVLSFPIDQDFSMPYVILGDIFINQDKLYKQAETYGHSYKRELTYLVVHSVLHLLGYDHLNEKDKEAMRKKEKLILSNIGIFK